jgi:peptidyl-prolyl cis-trans isomerase SDCCAG10
LESQKQKELQKKADKIREEINNLKKEYRLDRKTKDELQNKEKEKMDQKEKSSVAMKEFLSEQEKYSEKKKAFPKKGADRESHTLQLLSRFKNKLSSLKEKHVDEDEASPADDEVIEGDDWMAHKLEFQKSDVILAKDASSKADDWYDVYDPRNPLNKRKRGEKGENSSSKK